MATWLLPLDSAVSPLERWFRRPAHGYPFWVRFPPSLVTLPSLSVSSLKHESHKGLAYLFCSPFSRLCQTWPSALEGALGWPEVGAGSRLLRALARPLCFPKTDHLVRNKGT